MGESALIAVGTTVTFAKQVTQEDILQFAEVSGDFSPNHVDAAYMATTPYGRPIAHGVLTLGLMSTASTMLLEQADLGRPCVSLGYDRVRFLRPVFAGDTVTITYTVREELRAEARTVADVVAVNQAGETVGVATHILKYL